MAQSEGEPAFQLTTTSDAPSPLKPDQVQAYVDIATRRGYEAVITLSNDVALEGGTLVGVRTDGRRKHKVALWHSPGPKWRTRRRC